MSELIGRSAYIERDGQRRYAGRIADFVVEHPEHTFPHIDAVILKTKHGEVAAFLTDVESIDSGGMLLKKLPTIVRPPDD
ncbi:MAG: hypothetical protein IAI49_03170, partial [Candidatus Eremiobacteraeota bacterium]|nr:hypothetical protein [Candidatus Eremiobacteraeota bacterium]